MKLICYFIKNNKEDSAMRSRNFWDFSVYFWLMGWSLLGWVILEFSIIGLAFLPIWVGSTMWFFLIRKSIYRKGDVREQRGEVPERTRITSSIHAIQMVISFVLFVYCITDWVEGQYVVLDFVYSATNIIAFSLIGTRILYVLGWVWVSFLMSLLLHIFMSFTNVGDIMFYVVMLPIALFGGIFGVTM